MEFASDQRFDLIFRLPSPESTQSMHINEKSQTVSKQFGSLLEARKLKNPISFLSNMSTFRGVLPNYWNCLSTLARSGKKQPRFEASKTLFKSELLLPSPQRHGGCKLSNTISPFFPIFVTFKHALAVIFFIRNYFSRIWAIQVSTIIVFYAKLLCISTEARLTFMLFDYVNVRDKPQQSQYH